MASSLSRCSVTSNSGSSEIVPFLRIGSILQRDRQQLRLGNVLRPARIWRYGKIDQLSRAGVPLITIPALLAHVTGYKNGYVTYIKTRQDAFNSMVEALKPQLDRRTAQ
jgi:hypothetical protein